MKLKKHTLPFRKGSNVHGNVQVDTHLSQRCRVDDRGNDKSPLVLERDKALVEQVIHRWRQEEPVFSV